MTDPLLILRLLLLLGVANGTPVLVRKVLKDRFAAPLDGGLQFFDGRPILGTSKTIRGIVASILMTSIIGILLGFDFWLGASLASFSMLGDLASSFIKRRLGFGVHAQAFGLDQIPEALLPLLVPEEQSWPRLGRYCPRRAGVHAARGSAFPCSL